MKYWMHGAHLLVEGKKMSKSLGNFFTLRDLLGKGFTGREVRYLLLTAHYRETFNFTLEGLESSRAALARLDECLGKLRETAAAGTASPVLDPVELASVNQAPQNLLTQVSAALGDDLNVSAAWGVVFDWVRDTNRWLSQNKFSNEAARKALEAWQKLDAVFGLGAPREAGAPPEIVALLEQRQAARKAKDFQRADALRQELKAQGWVIEDTPKGPKLKKA